MTFVENAISNLPKVARAMFLGKDKTRFLAYANLAASRTLLQQILVCLKFILDVDDLFCW